MHGHMTQQCICSYNESPTPTFSIHAITTKNHHQFACKNTQPIINHQHDNHRRKSSSTFNTSNKQ